jgi:hypothetical protein
VNNWRGWFLDPRLLIIGGTLLGIGLGIAIGWLVWPVSYYDTDVYDLRADYQDEFVVLVGALYQLEGNVEVARQWLALLSPPDAPKPPKVIVVEVTERYIARGANATDIGYLVGLAEALGTVTTPMQPYLGRQGL